MNKKLILSSVAVTIAIVTIVFVFQIQPESESNIFFVTDPLNTFKSDYQRDRVENGDLKYLLEAEKKLHNSNTLPIITTYADGTLEAIQMGLGPIVFDTMTETEIADKIREIVDVTVYVFSEEPFYPKLGHE